MEKKTLKKLSLCKLKPAVSPLPGSEGSLGIMMSYTTLLTENRRLVADEPVEFEKQPVQVQDLRRIMVHFRGIYRRIYLK